MLEPKHLAQILVHLKLLTLAELSRHVQFRRVVSVHQKIHVDSDCRIRGKVRKVQSSHQRVDLNHQQPFREQSTVRQRSDARSYADLGMHMDLERRSAYLYESFESLLETSNESLCHQNRSRQQLDQVTAESNVR